MGEAVEFFTYSNGFSKVHYGTTHLIVDQNDDEQQQQQQDSWFEEEIDVHLKWSFALNSPKSVFIMGGGEGSAAREALRHKSIEKVVMCDIDQNIVKPKLNNNAIFVTQAGPAGCSLIRSLLINIQHYQTDVRAYTAHVPSFADTWGWVIASDQPLCIEAGMMDKKIAERIDGELLYLNGASFVASTILNKTVAKTLKNETHVYTEDDARFIHGQGVAYRN
ncbi:UNVERIFIED_CONTAM: Thermospermine synthase ACAULIS5 [Sesamum calycinum]|uniref:Thermospermine synthase ACAULIS5 n=1 Tax=Sesamum calycinum TaxID=2727403 RepID=A0AAW2LWK6_9LAMI